MTPALTTARELLVRRFDVSIDPDATSARPGPSGGFMDYDFARAHQTLRLTPAMEAGITGSRVVD